jgi:RNA polymerase sigma factor (sigma-70 family)
MNEQEAIRKIKSGDRLAMDALIEAYYQPVFSYFYRNTGDYHQSKDLSQEVFIKMVINIGHYQKRTEFKNWLFTIASNHLKNYWRYAARHPNTRLYQDEYVDNVEAESDIAQRIVIQQAITQLQNEQKEAVILRFYHGFKINEISKITDAKESTVKARIRYGSEKLKRILEGLEYE